MSKKANISREMERLVAQLKSTQEQIKSLQDQMEEDEMDPSLLEPVVNIQELCSEDQMDVDSESSPVELPPGWRTVKRNSAKQKTKYETVLKSPEGKHFYSCLSALQFMTRNRRLYTEDQVEIMKRNLRQEGWRKEKFLPEGWQLCEKPRPGGSSSSLTRFRFLSDKMRYFESTSTVVAFMRTNRYSQSQIDQFRSEMSSREHSKKVLNKQNKAKTPQKVLTVPKSAKKIVDKKETPNTVPVFKPTEADIIIVEEEESHDEKSKITAGGGQWERNSESLPPGWERRLAGTTKMEFIKSPGGSVFKSRYAAVRQMMKTKDSSVSVMKRKMVEHEGWEESNHLPAGWLVKVNWEGVSRDNKRYQKTRIYLSREGQSFTSMRGVQEYLSQSGEYSREEAERCWQFLDERNKLNIQTRFAWRPSDSVPPGWKVRSSGESEAAGSKEYILSPEGVQYKTRFVALQDLAAKSAPQEVQEELRRKMVEHENWEESPLLPDGWLFKVTWEGKGGKGGRWNSNLRYLSRDGVAFDSMKEVLAHLQLQLQTSPSLGQENIQNCQEFLRVRSQQNIELRHRWQSSETLPPGWRVRRAQGSQLEFFLSPHNTQYKSRFSAIQDMMVRADLYTEQEVELMKEKLISEESWQVSSLLPPGWLYKVVWEGQSKNKALQTNIWFLSGEGFYFESMKAAREYMRKVEGYQESHDEKCQQFLDEQRKSKSKSRYDWEEGGESLPAGWCRRTTEGKSGMEFILSPQGDQFKSRFAGLMWLHSSQADLAQIQEMKEKLSFEGWQSSDLLPEGWLYRRAFEGFGKSGSQMSTTLYLSREGECYDSVRTATEFLGSCGDYSQQDQDSLRQLHKMLGEAFTKTRSDWVEDEKTLPRLWKRRKCGKVEFFLRPDGRQFKSRLSGLQAMVREKYPGAEISEMRSHLGHEGWASHKLLPRHWRYRRSLTTWNKRKVTDYSFLSAQAHQFSSMRSARQFLTETYSSKQIKDWDSFVKEEAKVSLEKSHDWSDAACLPQGWRTRVGGGGEGRRYFLSPGGQQFLSLLTAYQHITSLAQPPLASLAEVRSGLASEGWHQSHHLPAGWLSKHSTSSVSFLDIQGNIYNTAKKALEAVEEDSSYSPEERSLLRKLVEASEVSLDEKYNWRSYPELPEGWKVRRKVSRSRKMIDFYLAPDGKHIRGRSSAVQHLISLGGQDSQISKLRNFSWFRRKTLDSLDNTLEELVSEQSDISLSSSFDSNASDVSDLCEDEKSSEVEQCQEYSDQDILDKLKHLQKLVKGGEQSEAQQTLLEIENSLTSNNKRRKQ